MTDIMRIISTVNEILLILPSFWILLAWIFPFYIP
jgi:hypothetical protein